MLQEAIQEFLRGIYIAAMCFSVVAMLLLQVSRGIDRSVKGKLHLLLCLLLFLPFAHFLKIVMGEPPRVFYALLLSVTWVYGPLAWLLTQNILLPQKRIQFWMIHFMPFFGALFYLTTASQVFSFNLYLAALMTQSSIYLGYSIYLFRKHLNRFRSINTDFQGSQYYWLKFLVFGLALMIVVDAILWMCNLLGANIGAHTLGIVATAFALFVSSLTITGLLKTFHQLEVRIDDEYGASEVEANKASSGGGKRSADRQRQLSDTAAKDIMAHLYALMEGTRVYLDPDLDQRKLAELLAISPQILSELLNTHMRVNFYAYLNSWRLKEALTLLKLQNLTLPIIDIAYRAGFNNRNTFYRVFREHTGSTPSAYRKRNESLLSAELHNSSI